jgi:hypothetical protein
MALLPGLGSSFHGLQGVEVHRSHDFCWSETLAGPDMYALYSCSIYYPMDRMVLWEGPEPGGYGLCLLLESQAGRSYSSFKCRCVYCPEG